MLPLVAEVVKDTHGAAPHLMPLDGVTQHSTYAVASWLLKIVNAVLTPFGLQDDHTVETIVYAIVVFVVAFAIGFITQWAAVWIIHRLGNRGQNTLYGFLLEQKFFVKIGRVIPAIVFLILIQFTLVSTRSELAGWLTRLTWIYVVFTVASALNALIGGIWLNIDSRKNKRHLPLNGLVQLFKGIIWIIAFIVAVAVIVNKSPGALLAGLGAFAAVLMLIFKDSILGLVAGVQLSENDILHVGDWIKVDGTNANGTVIDVSLTAVKVQNWDKTVTSVPPYNLVSGSFTNYKPMQDTGTRRICRVVLIDTNTILPATDEILAAVRKIPMMDSYITSKLAQKAAGKECDVNNPAGLADGTIETNLGLFRAYVRMYLDASPLVSHDDTCFVSTLEQTPSGVPLQIYCFTATSSWLPFEAMTDVIFEHIQAVMPQFSLSPFKNPSGRDTILEGYVAYQDPDSIFALPQPWLKPGYKPNAPVQPSVTDTSNN